MIFAIPLAIIFGILTFISLFLTAGLGIAVYKFHKNVFRFHMVFAFITLILGVIHLILVYLLFFKGLSI